MKKLLLIFFVLLLGGCGGSSSSSFEQERVFDADATPIEGQWYRPSSETTWQWQLSGDINRSYSVDLYDIDLFDVSSETIAALKADGKRVICYFSAGSYEDWREDSATFSDELLGLELDGWEGERWLDISNEKLAPIMQARLDLAKEKGCDGVEPDNVDGYSNDTGFNLDATNQLAYNKFLANEAHKRGLAIGLKNDLSQVEELVDFFDFALNEQCHYFGECELLEPFITLNKPVFNAEYESSYIVDGDINATLCQESNDMGLQTLLLPPLLDDSFRYSCNPKDRLFNSFNVGFGDSSAFKFQDENETAIWVSSADLMLDDNIESNPTYQKIKNFDAQKFSDLQSYLKNADYFTIWITKGWEESWFDIEKINQAIEAKKSPVFIYWYFGDELIESDIDSSAAAEYAEDNKRLKTFLDKIEGFKFLILEPEFNKESVLQNPQPFIDVISNAIDILKSPQSALSLCMTDTGNRGEDEEYDKCGYESCALGDKYEWALSKEIYDALLPKLDFISFQEMLGSFSRDPQNPGTWDEPNPINYTESQIGINSLAKRLENLSEYLYELYKKPVFLPYITVATATWSDSDDDGVIDSDEVNATGFELQAENFYADLNKSRLFSKHLIGFSPMALFDVPDHDLGGYQFFLNNEYHLGIIKSSAVDEVDHAINGDIEFKGSILESVFAK